VSRNQSSAVATTMSVLAVLGALVLFCLFFTAFLLVPFFIFLAGAIALVITERNSKRSKAEAPPVLPPQPPQDPRGLPDPRALPERTEGPR
jgi:hypothetical protein